MAVDEFRLIKHFDCVWHFSWHDPSLWVKTVKVVVEFFALQYALQAELGWHLRVVLQYDFFWHLFCHQNISKINFLAVDWNVRVLSHSTQSDDSLRFAFNFQHNCTDNDCSLLGGKLYFEVAEGIGHQEPFGRRYNKLCELELVV